MSIVKRTTKSSYRVIVIGLLLALVSTIALASNWDSVRAFAAASSDGFGFSAPNETSASPASTPVPFGTGPCPTSGPIEVESSNGTNATVPTAYATLGAAFTAINGGVIHTGVITIEVCADTDEMAATATLQAGNDAGTADYTSITISPVGGAARTITGATTAGSPMIDLSGADGVTIDGLNTGGNSLTISNTTVSATAATSTIRYINDATSNTIQNATVNGAGTGAATGTIFYSTTTGATGNDNNTVTACNIGPVAATFPANGILSIGTITSQATRNSGISITNNNIFDFFTNTAVIANGFLASAGTTDMTITGNSFYQTATRTMSVAASGFIGISIADTSSINNTISNNFIGGSAASAGGTAWTQTGAVTHTFIGIRMSVGSSAPTSLQNNRIQNLNISTSTTSTINAGISATTGALNIGTTTGNTIGATTGTGSITWTAAGTNQFSGILAGTGTPNGINISNNNIGSITVGGAAVTTFYGIRFSGAATAAYTVSGNTIGSTTTANSITNNSNGAFVGISGTQTLFPATVSNNVIQNLQVTSTGTGASLRGIELTGSISGQTISGNTIANFSTTSTATSTTTASAIDGIVFTGSSTSGNTITTNTIRDLSSTTSGAAAVYVQGIVISGTPGTTISRNFIYNLTTASTSTTPSINGIQLFNSSATENIYNNMIRLGVGVGNNPIIRGIFDNSASGSPTNILFNSIYIDGTQGAAAVNTSCINKILSSTMTVTNNILWNNRASTGVPGSNLGRHYGINTTSGNPTSNYNDIFTPNNGGAIGFSTADRITLADWRTFTSQDLNSQNSNPQFIDATNATTPDLHIHPTNATVIEGNGILVSPPTDDFDGQTRASFTPVDIGADAGNFNGVDLSAPVITYTALGNTSLTTNRVLSVTITDVTGVDTVGLAPRIYLKKNAGSFSSTACLLFSGTVQNGVWNCTIDNATFGGVVPTDVISYFVVAQDTLGNLAANPSAGFTGTNVNVVLTPPTTPNSYTIVAAISGSINVGTAETITSLTNTGGIFDVINNSEVTGNITINITSDLTTELGTVALNEFASPFTILIKPSGAPRTITGTINGALIRLNGADRVRFDGSTAASFAENVIGGNPALRQLTIQNTNVGTSAVVMSVGSNVANGAQNNTIQNVIVLGQDPLTSLIGISLGGTTPGTVGTDNDNNRVENCFVGRAIFGIYSAGVSLANQNTGTVITMNETSAVATDRIRRIGIVVFNDNGAQITENSINGVSTNESADAIGIGLGTQVIEATNTTSGGVTNALVSRNKINGISSLSATGFSAAAITVAGATGGANTIANNMITGVTAPATSPDIVAGIYVVGATGSSTRLYHNSIAMTGDRGAVATQMPSYGVAITGTDPTVELKNNIFYTTQIASGGGVNAKSYAIGMVTTTFANLDSNYNDFWSTGANDGGFRSGSLTTAAGTDYATLALWGAAVSDDAMSQEIDPSFINPLNDLHLNGAMTPLLGDGITGFATVDYDLDPRPASAPDIGADEVVESTVSTFPTGTFYNARLAGGDVLALGNVTVTNNLTLSGMSATGGNTITLGCNATVTGAGTNNYVIGNFAKQFCAPGTFTYPVGTTPDNMLVGNPSEYSPFVADVTAGTFPAVGTPPSLAVIVTDSSLGGSDPTQSASRFWDVTEIGDLTANISFTYLDLSPGFDVNGTETLYQVLRREMGTTNVYVGGTVNAVTNTGTAPGVTMFSQWAAGNLAPTAANATVGGRVLTSTGRGIYGARIVMIDPFGTPRMALTNPFGYYRFTNVPVGNTYVFSAFDKRYQFVQPSIVSSVDGDDDGINFVALGGQNDVNQNPTYFDKAPFDFDGDGFSDASVWREDSNSWYIRRSSDNTFYSQEFGLNTDQLAPADFDGDGRTDLAVFRPSEGNWYIWQSRTNSLRVERFGAAGDIQIPSDFDGDGKADLAVWRALKNVFVVKQSSNGQTVELAFEGAGENLIARTGDGDGDGHADAAVFDRASGTWLIRMSRNGKTVEVSAEGKGEVPLFADFDGDARADVGTFDVETGIWTVTLSRNGEVLRIQQGGGTDEPVIGDFDGDGRTDAGTYRNGTWLIKQSLTNSVRSLDFGLPTDKALLSADRGQ